MGTHYQGTTEEVSALNTYIKLMRAADSVSARATRHLTRAGVTPSQFGVLEALYHLGPLLPSQLAQKHLMSRGNITTVVDNLEKRGLVRRERDTTDRRIVRVSLTDEGRATVQEILPQHVSAIVAEMRCLTQQEQEEIGRLCRRLGKQE